MTGDSFSSGPKKQRIRGYTCKNHRPKREKRCSVSYVNADHLENFVKSQIREMLIERNNQGIDLSIVDSFKSKDRLIINNLTKKSKKSLDLIDKLVFALSNAKSETVIKSINKQISNAEDQIKTYSKKIDEAKQRLNKIETTFSDLIISDELFTNNLLNYEIINELGIKLKVDKKTIEL
jgi:hypothetical protein